MPGDSWMALSTSELKAQNKVPPEWKECNEECGKIHTAIQTVL